MEHDLSSAERGEYGALEERKGEAPSSPATKDDKNDPRNGSIRCRCTYGVFLLFGFVFALVTRNNYVQYITKWMIEHNSDCTDTVCVGNQGAYRISFALFTFFLVHYILSSRCNLCMTSAQKISFNKSGFCFKTLAFIPVLIISFIIPNPFFVAYAWLSVFLSFLFLVMQLVILLDFTYNWSEKWGQQEETRYQIGLLVCAGVLYVLSLTCIGLLYKWFAPDSSCQTSLALITLTLIGAVLYTFASVMARRGSVIPAGFVFLYTTWTCYSALASGVPAGTCNTLAPSSTSQVLIAVIFTVLSLVYNCVVAGGGRQAFQLSSSDDGEDTKTPEDDVASDYAFFHVVMVLGSCYLAMLVTNWTISGTSGTGMASVDSGTTPMWVKFSTEIICVLMYLWTLVAPSFCGGNREFEE